MGSFISLLWVIASISFWILLIIFILNKIRKKTSKVNSKLLAIVFSIGFLLFILAIIFNPINQKEETNKSAKPIKSTKTTNYKLYKLHVDNVSVTDLSDWKVEGTTDAPDGAKLFATYGDENDDNDYGLNAASSSYVDSWSTVGDGKFTMYVNPLDLHYEETYKGNTNFSAFLFAITGLKGGLSKYNDEPAISSKLKNLIPKNIDTTELTLNDSQADYYNSLGNSSSTTSSEPEISSSSSSSSEASSFSQSELNSNLKTRLGKVDGAKLESVNGQFDIEPYTANVIIYDKNVSAPVLATDDLIQTIKALKETDGTENFETLMITVKGTIDDSKTMVCKLTFNKNDFNNLSVTDDTTFDQIKSQATDSFTRKQE